MKCSRFCLLACVLALAGCGYRMGSLVTPTVRTVHIPMFDNVTFRRGLEVELTNAVRKEVTTRTHLRLADAADADTVLSGQIIGVREQVLTYENDTTVFSKSATIFVDFTWRDRRTGRVLASAANLNRPIIVLTIRGQSLSTATAESFRELAETIVDHLEGGW